MRRHSANRVDPARPPRAAVALLRPVPLLLVVLACLSAYPSLVRAQTPEHEIKAIYLYNFASFVFWPEQALPDRDGVLGFCVLGPGQVGGSLERVLRGEVIDGRRVRLWRLDEWVDIDRCHVLFVERGFRGDLSAVLRATADRRVLTVSDHDHFVESGGMIGLRVTDSRVRPVINLGPLNRGGFKVSSKLLRLSEVVGP